VNCIQHFVLPLRPVLTAVTSLGLVPHESHMLIFSWVLNLERGGRTSFMNKNVDNDYFELKHVGAAYMNSVVIK